MNEKGCHTRKKRELLCKSLNPYFLCTENYVLKNWRFFFLGIIIQPYHIILQYICAMNRPTLHRVVYYRPHRKDGEGTVSTGVCLSTEGGGAGGSRSFLSEGEGVLLSWSWQGGGCPSQVLGHAMDRIQRGRYASCILTQDFLVCIYLHPKLWHSPWIVHLTITMDLSLKFA